jgi:DNA polymerase-1
MLTIHDSIAGERIEFRWCESSVDARTAYYHSLERDHWAFDTESTGLNTFHPQWRFRTFQFGSSKVAYIIHRRYRKWIEKIYTRPDVIWVGHNAPHDARSVDCFLGYETGVWQLMETYIPGHYADPRNQAEGGIAHGLKDQAMAIVDGSAGKWDEARKRRFKEILIPIPGEVYKSGPRKGTQKFRRAKLSEGWGLIDPADPVMIAYAGSDVILAARVWNARLQIMKENRELYISDLQVQAIGDQLQRKGIKLDVDYTKKYRAALDRKAARYIEKAAALGCANIYSTVQLADALIMLGATLTLKTPTGRDKVDDKILRAVIDEDPDSKASQLCRTVLIAKRVSKRREAYADAMLREMDAEGRVHPSINTLAARTSRMSVSNPALQQLPTKESELDK